MSIVKRIIFITESYIQRQYHFGIKRDINIGTVGEYLIDSRLFPVLLRSLSHKTYSNRSSPFSKCFPSTRKRKASDFTFLWFESVFKKLRFRDGLVWTVGLTVDIILRFKISPI